MLSSYTPFLSPFLLSFLSSPLVLLLPTSLSSLLCGPSPLFFHPLPHLMLPLTHLSSFSLFLPFFLFHVSSFSSSSSLFPSLPPSPITHNLPSSPSIPYFPLQSLALIYFYFPPSSLTPHVLLPIVCFSPHPHPHPVFFHTSLHFSIAGLAPSFPPSPPPIIFPSRICCLFAHCLSSPPPLLYHYLLLSLCSTSLSHHPTSLLHPATCSPHSPSPLTCTLIAFLFLLPYCLTSWSPSLLPSSPLPYISPPATSLNLSSPHTFTLLPVCHLPLSLSTWLLLLFSPPPLLPLTLTPSIPRFLLPVLLFGCPLSPLT
ncbi:BCL-6 corepressor-like protein 1 [Eriocheir sinensis]|uniref:BCL-6 corepressor-like protein 1 n=1 Tax=Eriocheir sinensis TaxID=95602 RepID=UPI0021C9361C|nr:BCL-6 corepressor-like protein 1 [Eriocheir sinensis]